MGAASHPASKGVSTPSHVPQGPGMRQTGRPTTVATGSSRSHPILVDDNVQQTFQPQRKRKVAKDNEQDSRHPSKKGKPNNSEVKSPEKRAKHFRKQPTQDFLKIHSRAMTQRMFVIDRRRSGTPSDPKETVDIAGTTGNLYTVVIGKVPSCTCPHARKGNQCKHIVYTLAKTLKARFDLQYQLALLSGELREIFDKSPPLCSEATSAQEDTDGVRKAIEDDCPICCAEFNQEKDNIVYCKAACGNNIHKECFLQWAAQKKAQGDAVTCPFCRTPWEDDEGVLGKINAMAGNLTAEGYVNVADQLGISGYRDTSTYHGPWLSSMRRAGGLVDENPEISRWH